MNSAADTPALVWFRRDLRDFDHAALHHALRGHRQVHCAFIFDTAILDALPSRTDRRVEFIRESLVELDAALRAQGGALIVRHGPAEHLIPELAAELGVRAVFTNRDYEPDAIARDARVATRLAAQGQALHSFKDQVIFDCAEVLTQAGKPFGVFTPYKNAWLKKLGGHAPAALTPSPSPAKGRGELQAPLRAEAGSDFYLRSYPVRSRSAHLACSPLARGVPTLEEIGFAPAGLGALRLPPGMSGGAQLLADFLTRIDDYKTARDYPALKGVSYLSTHLRFGTVSIRELARAAWQRGGAGAETWLSELVWRDFYHQILYHHPHVVSRAWRAEYDNIVWDSGPQADAHFAAWCEARTGYPIVDAAMRQLNQTGYMHNRLRMVTASFLTKDLGIHWLRGERYFARQLNDYDLAANNGGWQWAASTGCDAQPYFRIFNPVSQSEKFDPQGKFIRRYLPELARVPDKALHAPWTLGPLALQALAPDYPPPIVDHALAREATLARFKRST